jgi:hypothetical protein
VQDSNLESMSALGHKQTWRSEIGMSALPPKATMLAADAESNGGDKVITFQRIIVTPDGHKYIEGVTPKALPAPDGDKDQ